MVVALLIVNAVLLFLLLASVGRIHQDRLLDMDSANEKHNWLVKRIGELAELNSSALSCLVSLDAKQSEQE